MAVSLTTILFTALVALASATDQASLDAQLFDAASKEDVEAVREALKAGANINAKSERGLQTPLMQSVLFGRESMVKLFLEEGADL